MNTHTPGPWLHVAIEGGWDGVESDTGLICKLSLNNPANATLIAAAPDLLRAAKFYEAWTHGEGDTEDGEGRLKALVLAIAKAEGR